MMTVRLLIFLLLVGAIAAGQTIRVTPEAVVLENASMRREIVLSGNPLGMLKNRITDKQSRSAILRNTATPWFSLPINNALLSSNDPIWRYVTHSIRKMMNGGTEFTIEFASASDAAAIVRLIVVTQMQPEGFFFRERICVVPDRDTQMAWTPSAESGMLQLNGYDVVGFGQGPAEIEEIRLATWGAPLLATDHRTSFDPKSVEPENRKWRNLEQNYMYHPVRLRRTVKTGLQTEHIGPFVVVSDPKLQRALWFAYEHGAPDDAKDQRYLNLLLEHRTQTVGVRLVFNTGAVYAGQTLNTRSPFVSVWYAVGNSPTSTSADEPIWTYLARDICENPASRRPLFYYNTWGMQRDESMRGQDIRGVLTEAKILQEIEEASELGIDLFVLDDGWQDKFGDWNVHPARLPNGLSFYVNRLREKGIMPGLWIAPSATDPDAAIARQHPDWLIRRDDDSLLVGQWQKNFFCFDSDFKDFFVQKCKTYIDLGIRYFKWDGINNYRCASPHHHHGTAGQSPEERKLLQGFDLPLLVVEALKELKAYAPDLIVEIDVTEPDRCVGLALLSEARYFWMNNGSSWYGDYSTYRAKSTRMITNLYGAIMPTTLQTYACFPMYDPVHKAQWHSVYSAIVGGRGFWGNIARMSAEERQRVGALVNMVKPVEQLATRTRPIMTGAVGASPEVYEIVNKETAAGKVLAFSGSALKSDYRVSGLNEKRFLGVVNHAFSVENKNVRLPFEFYFPDDAKMAVFLSNQGHTVQMTSSSGWLSELNVEANGVLRYRVGVEGEQTIVCWDKLTAPVVRADREVTTQVELIRAGSYRVRVRTTIPGTTVLVE